MGLLLDLLMRVFGVSFDAGKAIMEGLDRDRLNDEVLLRIGWSTQEGLRRGDSWEQAKRRWFWERSDFEGHWTGED